MLDFPQETADRDCYLNIPIVIEIQSDTEWVIKVNNNIYSKCQSGIVWNKLLV